MSFQPAKDPQIQFSLIGGLNTELAGPTLPEGLSPDNQDMAYVPGNGYTRPAAKRLLGTSLGDIGVTYEKTFVQANEEPLNLIYGADGIMRKQDVLNSPGTVTPIFQTVPHLYASSVTAFNAEYFAFHDGLFGRDIPRQYDGQKVRRVTQDGVAVGASSVADAGTTTIPIVNIVPKAQVNIVTATQGDGIITIVTATAHGLTVGDNVLLTGISVYQYNGPEQVATVPNPTSFTYDTAASGLAQGTGGSVIPDTVTVETTVPNDLITGETITIAGNSDSNYNNSTGLVNETVGLASAPIVTTYPYNDSNGGAFNYTFPHQGFNEPLPGPTQTVVLGAHDSIMFNPNGPLAGTNLPGAPSENNPPLLSMGVNSSGTYNGVSTPVSSSSFDFALVVTVNIAVSAAGNVTFQIVHKEGTILGIGGGATYVSGQLNDPQPGPPPIRSGTAKNNYPIMYMNNGSTEFYHVSIFNQQFTVNFPAAGVYPLEINYVQWHHSNPVLALLWQNSVPAFVPLQPGTVVFQTPATWTVGDIIDPTHFKFDAVYAVGTGTGGTITVGGLISPGKHQMVVSFQTDTGYITKPSPPVSWNSAGNKRVVANDLPIGPSNTVARICSFTGTGGGQYFYIPVPAIDPSTGQTVSTSTVVNDNTSTTATFDFADNTLFDGIGIDITGNNLFAQVVLGPVAGLFSYSNRLVAWGDVNKIQDFLNMGFEGGIPTVGDTLHPLGWDVSQNQGGQLVDGDFGSGWRITGNGLNVARGMIFQNAFENNLHRPLLTPKTQYTFECFAFASVAGMPGNIVAEFYSATGGGSLATAMIPANSLGVGITMSRFVSANFSLETPVVIPSDTVLRLYGLNLSNGQYVVIDENMVIFTAEPFVPGQYRVSYAFAPEQFDGITGVPAIEYAEQLMSFKTIRDNLYILSSAHLSRTQDNGVGEPITWANYTVSDKVGGLSLRSFDTGEGDGFIVAESGLYAFSGGMPQKISQEIQTLWNALDPNLLNHVWVKNDQNTRRIYIGVPLTKYSPTGRTFTPESCNKVLVMDYRELNTATAIEGAAPLHISMTGRMLSSDLTRKWSVWNLPMNCGEIISMPNQEPAMSFGSGLGNGVDTGFGNVYTLDETLTSAADDEYGVIGSYNGESLLTYADWVKQGLTGVWRPRNAYYVTYFAPSHEQEQGLQLGSQRHLYMFLEAYVPGVGDFYAVPLLDRVGNPTKRPPRLRSMVETPNQDFEWPLNHHCQRMAFLFYAYPSPNAIPPVVVIDIEPETASLSTFATQSFTYTLTGTPTLNVVWSTSGGSITSGGLYTAPGIAGTYTVTVTSVDDPSAHDTAIVTVHGGYDGA